MTRRTLLLLVGTIVVTTATLAGQGLEVHIVSPAPDAYVSEQIVLEARIDPPARRREVAEVVFFADGREACRTADVQRPRCTWDAGAVVRSHLIRVVATMADGERLVANTRTRGVDYAESVDVRAVQVNVSVFDQRGTSVRGLTADRFRLLEDGVPQTITNFANEESPLELVLALDVSGSMGLVIEDLKSAVREFLGHLRPIDQVTLVAFNEEMFVLTRRETDAAARARAVDALAPWGSTALYDVIVRSLDLLSRQPGRRGLVVFSDGEDRSSQTTLAAVERAVKTSDATLFTVALGRGRESADLKRTLETLAEPSGGRAIMAEGAEDLRRAFGDALRDLQQQYLLGYQSTNSKQDGTWRRLTVEVPGERYRVRAREGYLAVRP